MKRRHQTSTERDMAGLAARKERDAAVPEFVCEDITGSYTGDELVNARRTRRSTEQRVEHLENKYDRLVHQVLRSRTRIIVAIAGAIGAIAGFCAALLAGCSL